MVHRTSSCVSLLSLSRWQDATPGHQWLVSVFVHIVGTNNNQQLILQTTFRAGTWNVRGMTRPGKVENIVSEAAAMQLDVCGLSETHWTQSGEMTIGERMVITSSDQNRNYQGVGLIISKNLRKSVMSYNAVSSRIITIRIKARPANMSIIQIYAPTLDKDDDVHDEFYEQLQATMESIKRSDYLIVLGDFNAILGNEKVPCVTGAHGTGIRNNSGQRLLEFCSANDLFVTNTGFRHHLRCKTTWISPD